MSRLSPAVLALVLLAAACGGGGSGGVELISPDDVEITGQVLAYGLQPGQRIAYDFDMSIDMDTTMSGGGQSGEVEMAFDAAGVAKYAVGAGPEPGTVAVTMKGSIDDIELRKFSLDGQSMAGATDLDSILGQTGAGELIPELTVLLDRQGNVLGVNAGGQDLTGLLGGSDMLGSLGPSSDTLGLEGFFGPAFPAEKLTVGSQWTSTDRMPVPMFGEIGVTSTHLVSGREDIDGARVFVVKSDIKTDEISLDLAKAFEEMANAAAGDFSEFGMSGDDFGAMMAELGGQFSGTMDMAPMRITATTWFDAERGVVVKSTILGIIEMDATMEMAELGQISMVVHATMAMDLSLLGEKVVLASGAGAEGA